MKKELPLQIAHCEPTWIRADYTPSARNLRAMLLGMARVESKTMLRLWKPNRAKYDSEYQVVANYTTENDNSEKDWMAAFSQTIRQVVGELDKVQFENEKIVYVDVDIDEKSRNDAIVRFVATFKFYCRRKRSPFKRGAK